MPLLSADEAMEVSDAFLHTLYGTELFSRWRDLKLEMNFISEREFVSWVIDVIEEYKQFGVGGYVGAGGDGLEEYVGGEEDSETSHSTQQHQQQQQQTYQQQSYQQQTQAYQQQQPQNEHHATKHTASSSTVNRRPIKRSKVVFEEGGVVAKDSGLVARNGCLVAADDDLVAEDRFGDSERDEVYVGMKEEDQIVTDECVGELVPLAKESDRLAVVCGGQLVRPVTGGGRKESGEGGGAGEGKKFRCQFCSYSSRNKSDLEKHVNAHLGRKPHECHWCGKTFSDPSSRNRHSKIIHHRHLSLTQ